MSAAALEAFLAERLPRDPNGCLRCDGYAGSAMFCAYCVKELEQKAKAGS